MFLRILILAGLLFLFVDRSQATDKSDSPNIVVVMADDLGYGDASPLNPKSQIPTPAFERLAKEGATFVDAHSPSAVCTPTRYGLLCGRYCWRTRLKRGVLGGYSRPLVDLDQPTVATVLKNAGYATACVGKWHLGLGWQWKQKAPDKINNFGIAGRAGLVAYDKRLTDTPIHHGFDRSYIIPASLDMSPYVYIENDRVTQTPDSTIKASSFPAFYRKGEIASDFKIIDVLDHLTQRATNDIKELAARQEPYFLYFPLPAPHKPVIPTPKFQGKSQKGPYGDFVMQVDDVVRRVMEAIDATGESDNTVLIFTSDNGSFMHRYQDENKPDHVARANVQGYYEGNHRANGPLRGTKADVWEGGHRVPFFVRWKKQVSPGTRVRNTICHVDLLATCAELGNAKFNRQRSEDSFSFVPLLKSEPHNYTRPPVIHHSAGGTFAIRQGKWKLILGSGSGGRAKPKGKPFNRPFHLFDMEQDLGETQNLIDSYPDVEKKLIRQFETLAHGDQNSD